MDSWGEDFRTDYSRIGEIRRKLGNPPVIACTATAGVETRQRVLDSLDIRDARILVSGVDRPNIALVRLKEWSDRHRAEIVAALLAKLTGRAMIFIPSVKVGQEVQAALASVGWELPLYYGERDKLERDHIQHRFSGQLDPPLNAIITTSAFSMGVDIPDVRLVVHWQHPASVEAYLQEFGRAGRDGKPSLALLFTKGEQDTGLLEWMAERSAEDVVSKRKRTQAEAQQNLAGRVRRIQKMQMLVSDTNSCFRAGLLEVLQGPQRRQRRSLARLLLDLVFASRTHVERAGACCDRCHPELTRRIRAGAYAPGDKLTKSRLDWRKHLRRLSIVFAGLLAFAVILGTFYGRHETSLAQRAASIYSEYVARRDPTERFTAPKVRPFRGYYIACAKPRRADAATLCLLIHADRTPGHAVSGTYRRRGARHSACTGDARHLHIC